MGATGGTGLRALPIVHALNLHFQYCTEGEIAPIVFHQDAAREQLLLPMRDANTERMWIDDTSDEANEDVDQGRIYIAVESRPPVRTQLLNYLHETIAIIPQRMPQPVAVPAAPAGPGRPILQVSGHSRRRSQGLPFSLRGRVRAYGIRNRQYSPITLALHERI